LKRRLIVTSAIFTLFFAIVFGVLHFTNKDAKNVRESVLRFHIVANSDSDIDQQNKLAVRDGVAQLCSELFYGADTKQDAIASANINAYQIEQKAQQILLENGSDDSVKMQVTKRFFPTRHYEGVSLPAGVYDTVDITIGEGNGKNFWCVMFPDICVGAATDVSNKEKLSDVLNDGALSLTTDDTPSVRFRFKLVELYESIKNFVGYIHFG